MSFSTDIKPDGEVLDCLLNGSPKPLSEMIGKRSSPDAGQPLTSPCLSPSSPIPELCMSSPPSSAVLSLPPSPVPQHIPVQYVRLPFYFTTSPAQLVPYFADLSECKALADAGVPVVSTPYGEFMHAGNGLDWMYVAYVCATCGYKACAEHVPARESRSCPDCNTPLHETTQSSRANWCKGCTGRMFKLCSVCGYEAQVVNAQFTCKCLRPPSFKPTITVDFQSLTPCVVLDNQCKGATNRGDEAGSIGDVD